MTLPAGINRRSIVDAAVHRAGGAYIAAVWPALRRALRRR